MREKPLIPLYKIRNQTVVLDSDLAALYQVPTKRLNEQVKRNQSRFPEDFAFQLTTQEFVNLRSQIATSSLQDVDGEADKKLRSQIVTSSYGGRRSLPFVFTEHGALMAASVLNSERAVEMSVFVIRAFVRMREELSVNAAILKRLAEIDKTLLVHDKALRDVYQKLLPLLQPTPEPSKKRMGFQP